MKEKLVGVFEVAELLNVSRQRVDQLVKTDPTFPAPDEVLKAGRVWRRTRIEEWMRSRDESAKGPRGKGR